MNPEQSMLHSQNLEQPHQPATSMTPASPIPKPHCQSLVKTLAAVQSAGLDEGAGRLAAVSGNGQSKSWEKFARVTFMTHAKNIPAEKLRFLQCIDEKTADWWGSITRSSSADPRRWSPLTTSPFPGQASKGQTTLEHHPDISSSFLLTPYTYV